MDDHRDHERAKDLHERLAVRRLLRTAGAPRRSPHLDAEVDRRRAEVDELLKRFGPRHPDVLRARRRVVGALVQAQGRTDEVVEAAEASYAAHAEALPEDSPRLHAELEWLAELLADAGRTDAAVAALQAVVAAYDTYGGHPLVPADRLLTMADVQRAAGRDAAAVETLAQVERRLDERADEGWPTTAAIVRAGLARRLRERGDEAAAHLQLERARNDLWERVGRHVEDDENVKLAFDLALGLPDDPADGHRRPPGA